MTKDETDKIGLLEMTRVFTMDDVMELYRLHPGLSPEDVPKLLMESDLGVKIPRDWFDKDDPPEAA